MLDKIPPQNIEAEQSVLGSMLIEQSAIVKVSDFLQSTDFYREAHRIIFKVILDLFARNEAVDIITVTDGLRKADQLESAGGISYVTALANSVPTAANVVFHAKIVEEKALLRRLINAATDIASLGYEDSEEVAKILDLAEQKILAVSSQKIARDFLPVKESVFDAIGRIEQLFAAKGGITGIPTGFADLDRLTAGLQASDLILIAARPSMGKTAFVLNVAQNVAIRHKKTVAFFSLEMSQEQLVTRMLCAEAPVDSQRLRIGEVSDGDWKSLIRAADDVAKAPIYIDDTAGISVMEMRNKARRLKAEHGLDLLIIDYLQLMDGGTNSRLDNRQQQISEISRSLKGMARELKVPIIALSQLSRGPETRTNKRPMLSDLRESGSLEQDADIVAFLYRDDYYNPESENPNITELIISKHRNGPQGTIQLYFHKQFTLFKDASKRTEE